MSTKQTLGNRLSPDQSRMAEPLLLTGSDISLFVKRFDLHLTEASLALGINTAALYTKQNTVSPLASTVSILIRLYSAFPSELPKVTVPDVNDFMDRIMKIDSSFKKSHLGPLLGLETNSSFRLHKGFENASQTAKQLIHLINRLLDLSEDNWWVIRDAVEIEAHASEITPIKSVWTKGGWSKGRSTLPADGAKKRAKPRLAKGNTAKKLIRRTPAET